MRITKRQLRRIIKEELAYGEFARDPLVVELLLDAGFNADGSFGADGMPGPSDWHLYSPDNIEEAGRWVEAALAMNDALKGALRDLEDGIYDSGQEAWFNVVYPIQSSFSDTGAADTEGREVAGNWLEKAGWEW